MVRILWASPLPPVRSGVSDYAVELLQPLSQQARVRVVAPPDWSRPSDWPFDGSIEIAGSSEPPLADEIQLVHLGNNPYHEWLLPRLAMPRTVVVLHDLVLHHLLVESTVGRGLHEQYELDLVAAHGERGQALARARAYGLTGLRDPFLFPAFEPFLAHVIGLVVHSDWARDRVRAALPEIPIGRVDLSAADPGEPDRHQVRRGLGISSDELLLMHLGFLTPEKGMNEILNAVAAARHLGIAVHLVLVGEGRAAVTIQAAAARIGIGDHISFTGWVAKEEMLRLPVAADLGVVMRRPSAGETSAAVLRFLACGTPVAVIGLHQFLEWPQEAAPRITPGPAATAELTRLLVHVTQVQKQESWHQRRLAARQAYLERHRPEQAAASLVAFLGELNQG